MPRTSTVFGVLLFVGIGVVGVACGGVLLLLGRWFQVAQEPTEPVGAILVYETVMHPHLAPSAEQTGIVAEAFNRRLQSGRERWGQARAVDMNRIEVDIYGTDPARLEMVKSRLAALGTLEFRILANHRDHAELIELALASEGTEIKGKSSVGARWAPLATNRVGAPVEGFLDDNNLVVRQGPARRHEVLLVIDPLNVTGRYLTQVKDSFDQMGRPSIDFKFNAQGAQLFTALTSENLPDHATGFTRRLAIVLNGEVHSGPSIQSTIAGEGEITGDFTPEETAEIVAVLNSGSLPTAVKLIDERSVAPATAPAKAGN